MEIIIYCTMYRIRQKICGIKFSPIASPLYWGKIFTKFNFANRVRSTLQEVVVGAGHTVLCTCVYVASFPVLHHSYRRLQYEYALFVLLVTIAVRIRVIRTASDDSCGGGLGTRLAYTYVRGTTFHDLSWKSEVSRCNTNSVLAGVFSYLDFHLLVQLHVRASLFRPHASGHGLL